MKTDLTGKWELSTKNIKRIGDMSKANSLTSRTGDTWNILIADWGRKNVKGCFYGEDHFRNLMRLKVLQLNKYREQTRPPIITAHQSTKQRVWIFIESSEGSNAQLGGFLFLKRSRASWASIYYLHQHFTTLQEK